MSFVLQTFRFPFVCLGLALAACGGGGGDDALPPPPVATTTIGAAGGTVTGPNGATLVIPPGALATNTTIAIEQTSVGAPPLPAGLTAIGQTFAFTPHGTAFLAPVTLTLPFDPASVPAGATAELYKTNVQNQWERVSGATFGTVAVTAQVTGFSFVRIIHSGLFGTGVHRNWSFTESRVGQTEDTVLDTRVEIGGDMSRTHAFGSASFDKEMLLLDGTRIAADGIANGAIGSSADGKTLYVATEAPSGNANIPNDSIGSSANLEQVQTFVKRAADASLRIKISSASIEVNDRNAVLGRICPPNLAVGLICPLLEGRLFIEIEAISTDPQLTVFYHLAGGAAVTGFAESWNSDAWAFRVSRVPMWTVEDFDFVIENAGGANESRVVMKLREPHIYVVDLSSIPVDRAFHLRVNVQASTLNRISGPPSEFASSANAFLGLPLNGEAMIETSGLEAAGSPPVLTLPAEVPVVPANCVPGPGPNPAAGTLQFSAASYLLSEGSTVPAITVTRTGGSSGAVTATFATSNGSAVAGTDYTAVNASVFFADGDAAPRRIEVPIIQNQTAGEPDKTVKLTLSRPGGCAALGAQATAVLTIRDDEPRPPAPSGLDPTFGSAGKAVMPETGIPPRGFGGDRSAMALQADGKIVMVGGSFTDFILARFNANGSLDTSFGIDGKVTTDMGGGPFEQEEALGVAIQADGKIVVVGHTSIHTTPPAPNLPPTFALARYTSDGNLDPSFGSGGKVSANVNGIAYAVAIQPDGKIVVAGEFSFASSNGSDFSDFTVARFNSNGTLDLGFGGSGTGQVATDIGSSTNTARHILLQPNGAIVVSGKPQGSQPGFDHTDIARYTASGVLDPSFGSGGKLTIAGADVGQGMARQADGRFVLVGSVTEATVPATARFLLKRLNLDGSPDLAFGTAGTVDTAFTQSATAGGVALQGDGKIVVIGTRAFSANANFIVARYNANGSVDTGFGIDGNLSIDFFGFTDIGENVLVQSDGKIVVSGQAQHNFDGYGLARINP